ncbi:transcriptional regulator [Kineosporia sp. R_H_3]|uniref:transcriptional regulator n=1 Tax=Kineosporia sp. R_H_3 TaxID=1961848 RepID=UPI000B4B968F|nr:transcriptional regulator [Kineosporia sp. R_H_3]
MADDAAQDLDDLTLHGVRVLGYGPAARVSARYGLDLSAVEDSLLDAEAYGWVRRTAFGGSEGWSVTERGKAETERRAARVLDVLGVADAVRAVHADFLPVNARFGEACTRWQIRPTARDPLAANDHEDLRWDHHVLTALRSLQGSLDDLCARLAVHLPRFGVYPPLYAAALARVGDGEHAWLDAPDRDSLHLVWIQLHEDLLATLGLPRGRDT